VVLAFGDHRLDLARQALQVEQNDPNVLVNGVFVLARYGQDIGAMIELVDRALAQTCHLARPSVGFASLAPPQGCRWPCDIINGSMLGSLPGEGYGSKS
jgi:hypothetical protein